MVLTSGEEEALVTNAQVGPWWLVLRGLARQAARTTEADRGRAALLVAVSHDLRTRTSRPG
jgi:hypothetical protein